MADKVYYFCQKCSRQILKDNAKEIVDKGLKLQVCSNCYNNFNSFRNKAVYK
jgi:hypothetical protein